MREADDDAIRRARVYVDTRAGATKEAGDIVQPLASGVLKPDAIVADLHELARGEKTGRASARRDHAVQVGRRGARRPRRRDRGLPEARRVRLNPGVCCAGAQRYAKSGDHRRRQ